MQVGVGKAVFLSAFMKLRLHVYREAYTTYFEGQEGIGKASVLHHDSGLVNLLLFQYVQKCLGSCHPF